MSSAGCAQQPSAFDQEFAKALSARGVPEGEIYGNCIKILDKYKLAYKLQTVHPRFFLTHMANRGGLMLSPHNAHRNATRLYLSKAADKKQLVNAVCFELAASGKTRELHLQANERLISRSNEYLAPMTGDERYVTVGCGHTVAFCKVAAINGKTPSVDLQDSAGNIDPHKIAQHEVFGSMVNDGWDWLVINSKVDEDHPTFAKVAQKALNVSNHVASEMSELETAKILADNAADRGLTSLDNWKTLALENVRALSVPCAAYAQHILEFVQYFAGGENAPLVTFLDDVAKHFHCHVNLGENFWQALSQVTFHDTTKRFPLIRVAFALTNLTSDKVEDGISRLLQKQDLVRLSTKGSADEAWRLEQMLQDGLDIADKVSSREAALQIIGQFFVRISLKATKKERLGRDTTVRSIAEIQALFLEDMGKLIQKKIVFEKWDTANVKITAKAPAPAPTTDAKSAVASLTDHGNATWIAQQNGFVVGQNVVKRGVPGTDTESLFVVFSISEEEVVLKQLCTYHGRLGQVRVQLADFIKEWITTRAEPAIKMAFGQQRSPALNLDLQKAAIFKAVMECDPKSAAQSNLVFWRKPDSVRVGDTNIKEGALVLVPILPMINVSTKSSPSAISFGNFKVENYPAPMELFGLPVQKPPMQKALTQWPEGANVAAYWWVEETSDKKRVNMVAGTMYKHGITVPILSNSVPLEPHTKLCKYKAAPPKKNLAPALEGTEAGGAGVGAKPAAASAAKKRKAE